MSNVTLDVAGTQSTGAAVTTVSYLGITVGIGNNRALVASIVWLADPGPIIIALWDQGGRNQSLYPIIGPTVDGAGHYVALFGLINPINGNKVLRLTWTNSTEYAMNVVSWTNVSQKGDALSFPNAASNTGNDASPTITITLPTDGAGVSGLATGTGFILNSVSATQLMLVHGIGSVEMGGSYSTSSGIFSGSCGGTEQWAMVATGIAPFVPDPSPYRKIKKVPWQQRMIKC